MRDYDVNRLTEEYQAMIQGLKNIKAQRENDMMLANPVLPDDILQDAIPGNIRTADHFVSFLRRFVEYIKTRLRVQHVVQESPAGFLKDVLAKVCIERKPLRFAAERLASLLRTLEITEMTEFGSLVLVRDTLCRLCLHLLRLCSIVTDHTFCHTDLDVHERIHRHH